MMGKPLKIGVDIDGCLADFNQHLIKTAKDYFGINVPECNGEWNWFRPCFASVEFTEFWDILEDQWHLVPRLPWAHQAAENINDWEQAGCQIYFITARPGSKAKAATTWWLRAIGVINPSVIMDEEKVEIIKALHLDVFVDDMPGTCHEVKRLVPGCQAILFAAPQNQKEQAGAELDGIPVMNWEKVALTIDVMRQR